MNNKLIREIHCINQNYNFIITSFHYSEESKTLTFQLNASGYSCAKLVYNFNDGKFENPRSACGYLSNYKVNKIIKLEAELAEAIKNLW